MSEMADFDIFATLIETLRKAKKIVVLTGAGISAESGLATFRDPMSGLWAKYNPQDLATPEAFRRDPKLVWEWYQWRREQVEKATPNSGHRALVKMEQLAPHFTLITQNVDSLHQRAGSKNVLELHGNISRAKCFEDNKIVTEWEETGDVPPRCPRCGGLLRPDVVWFGEMLPEATLHAAVVAARNSDVFFSIGTSGQVEPAASLPRFAQQNLATVITINLEVETQVLSISPLQKPPSTWGIAPLHPQTSEEISIYEYSFKAKAGEFLPLLVSKVWGDR